MAVAAIAVALSIWAVAAAAAAVVVVAVGGVAAVGGCSLLLPQLFLAATLCPPAGVSQHEDERPSADLHRCVGRVSHFVDSSSDEEDG